MLKMTSPYRTAVFFARIVMPFSRSRSFESITRSLTSWLARNAPDCQSRASTSVVLPWSTWATIARLRRSERAGMKTFQNRGKLHATAALGLLSQFGLAIHTGLRREHEGGIRRSRRRPEASGYVVVVAAVVVVVGGGTRVIVNGSPAGCTLLRPMMILSGGTVCPSDWKAKEIDVEQCVMKFRPSTWP